LEEFFKILKETVNMDNSADIRSDTELESLSGWDSLGKFMLLSSVYSDYGVTLDVAEVNGARTAGDLWAVVDGAKNRG
jgi:acyl carrier protein